MELNGWASPQMLRRYGASARSAQARRTYDRINDRHMTLALRAARGSGVPHKNPTSPRPGRPHRYPTFQFISSVSALMAVVRAAGLSGDTHLGSVMVLDLAGPFQEAGGRCCACIEVDWAGGCFSGA